MEGFDKKKTTLGGITYTYCKPCDKCLAIRESYRKHLFVIHRINWRLIQQEPKNIVLHQMLTIPIFTVALIRGNRQTKGPSKLT